jgi:hypothetical protein
MQLTSILFFAALIGFVVGVVVFARLVWPSRTPRQDDGGAGGTFQQQAGLDDVAKVIDALGKTAESFRKSGPAVMAALLAILSLLIMCLAAGLDKVTSH